MIMKKDSDYICYVKYETAKMLNEIGFDIQCTDCYCKDENGNIFDSYSGLIPDGCEFLFYRPQLEIVQKWFREKHNIHICPKPKILFPDFEIGHEYHIDIYSQKNVMDVDGVYWGFEDALENGIILSVKLIKNK